MPVNFDVAKGITFRKRFRLTSVNHDQWLRLNKFENRGNPHFFYYYEGNLFLYPHPNVNDLNTTLDSTMTVTQNNATLSAVSDMETRGRFSVGSGDSLEVIEYSDLASTGVVELRRGLEGTGIHAHDTGDSITYHGLEFDYFKTLTDLVATASVSSIAVRYHEAAVLYSAARFFESQEDIKQANQFQARYLRMKEKAKMDLGQKQAERFTTALDDTEHQLTIGRLDNTFPRRSSLE